MSAPAPGVDRLVLVAHHGDVAPRAAPGGGSARTARGSCPGTRRPARSGSGAGRLRAPPRCRRAAPPSRSSRSSKSSALRGAQDLRGSARRRGRGSGRPRESSLASSGSRAGVLAGGDPGEQPPRRVSFSGQVEGAQGLAHRRQLVVLVVDHEIRARARPPPPRGAGGARTGCGRWRSSSAGACPGRSASVRAFISPAALLVKVTARIASEGTPLLADQVGDAVGDHARLAAARAGQDEHRALRGQHGLALLRSRFEDRRDR